MEDKKKLAHKLKNSLKDTLYIVFPPVMSKLALEASKAKPDLDELVQIISLDPALSAAILSLANSPFYSLSQKVTDIKRAAVVLGAKEILKIAISITFQRNLSTKLEKCYNLKYNTWSQIVWGASASELLAKKVCPEKAEMVYLCSLLKDLSLLLICCLKDERADIFKKLQPENKQNIISLHGNQLKLEENEWGITHPELTLALLDAWGFPAENCQGIGKHHDIENLHNYSPCDQAIILGTYWAEAEFAHRDFEALFQLKQWAKKIFHIDAQEFEALRAQNTDRFKALCQTLGIRETENGIKLYELPVQRIQDFYFMAQEIGQSSASLEKVVKTVAKHLYWTWNLSNFYLALRSPLTRYYHLNRYQRKEGVQALGKYASFEQIPISGKLLPLSSGSLHIGGLWIDKKELSHDLLEELNLYSDFLARHYKVYYYRQLGIESKAKAIDLLPVGIAQLNLNGEILQLNRKLKEILGVNTHIQGTFFWNLMSQTHKLPPDPLWLDFLEGKSKYYSKLFCSFEPTSKQKEPCWHIAAHKVKIEKVEQIMVVVQDISDITSLEADIVRQREFLHGVIESMQDLVLTVDKQGQILFATPKYAAPHLKGKNLFTIATPAPVIAPIWGPSILDQQDMPIEATIPLGNTLKTLELIITKLSGPTPQYLIVGRDLTTIRRLEQKIKMQATFDYLTKIFNRHQLKLFLKREVSRAKRTGKGLGLIFFDLDKFKTYNDRFGHQEGDRALAKLGRILRQNSRQGMDFPCRYGGDEFVLLASEVDKDNLEALAERIKESFDQIFKGQLTLSIGLAMLKEGEDANNLLYKADLASYRAKSSGGKKIIWAEDV